MNIDRLKRQAHSIADLRRVAQRRLPKAVFDFVDGGAKDEKVVRRNESAFTELAFLPSPLNGLIGRPHLWGLASAGRDGVALALDIYRGEIDRVMGLCGWSRLSQVDRSVLGSSGLVR